MNSLNLAKKIRIDVVNMVNKSGASHIGPILSIVDIIAVLYGKIMRYDIKNPKLETRDRLILSKGHGGAAVYASLAEVGFFDKSECVHVCYLTFKSSTVSRWLRCAQRHRYFRARPVTAGTLATPFLARC